MSHIASSYNRSVFFYIPRCFICGDIQNTLYSFILGFSSICSTERTQTVDILSKPISVYKLQRISDYRLRADRLSATPIIGGDFQLSRQTRAFVFKLNIMCVLKQTLI